MTFYDIILMFLKNSRCCCNETPPPTGRNLDLFLPALHQGTQQSCNTPAKLDAIMFAQPTLVINSQDMWAFQTLNACYKYARFWQSFLVNNFADFLRVKNQEFIQSLVAFPLQQHLFNYMMWLW